MTAISSCTSCAPSHTPQTQSAPPAPSASAPPPPKLPHDASKAVDTHA